MSQAMFTRDLGVAQLTRFNAQSKQHNALWGLSDAVGHISSEEWIDSRSLPGGSGEHVVLGPCGVKKAQRSLNYLPHLHAIILSTDIQCYSG